MRLDKFQRCIVVASFDIYPQWWSRTSFPLSEKAHIAVAWNLRLGNLGNMAGTAGARVRPTP